MSKLSGIHPRLCQEATPQSEWPYAQDWIVSRVNLAPGGYDSYYPVYVHGLNLNDGREFIWALPLPLSWRYDLSNAEYGPGVLEGGAA
jgi:hypothetical protein